MADCECRGWASDDQTHMILTGHHVKCQKAGKEIDAALVLIAEMAHAMDLWAAEEDGVHPDAWTCYRKAKALQGVII